jgi:hypothetical protein
MLEQFIIYHIVSIAIGASALVVVLVLYLKTRRPRLLHHILANSLLVLLVASLSVELHFDILNIFPPVRGLIHEGEQFLCLGLCAIIPRVGRPAVLGLFSNLESYKKAPTISFWAPRTATMSSGRSLS